MTAFWHALYAYKADIVLDGNDHMHERLAPQAPRGRSAPGRGIRQFVVGTGGKSFYRFGNPIDNGQARNSNVFGVLRLVLHLGSYDWNFLPVAGDNHADSGSAKCVT